MKRSFYLPLFTFFIFFFSSTVFAKDYFIEDNGELEIVISKNNVNRVKIFRDRIKDIRANADELKIETDKSTGEIYVRLATNKDSVDVFLKTENGFTYKLILQAKDVKAQQIFINREDFSLFNYANSDIIRREKLKLIDENLFFDFADNYQLSAINLIRAMLSRAKLKQFSILDREYQKLLNYGNLKAEWLHTYRKNDKSGISGEIIRITNTIDKSIELQEEMFFRHGIRAVTLEKTELKSKESCYLYLVGGDVK